MLDKKYLGIVERAAFVPRPASLGQSLVCRDVYRAGLEFKEWGADSILQQLHPNSEGETLRFSQIVFDRQQQAPFGIISVYFHQKRTVSQRYESARPISAAALDSFSSRSSSASPVAILPIRTAKPIASAGRFSPRGPLGTGGVSAKPVDLLAYFVKYLHHARGVVPEIAQISPERGRLRLV